MLTAVILFYSTVAAIRFLFLFYAIYGYRLPVCAVHAIIWPLVGVRGFIRISKAIWKEE